MDLHDYEIKNTTKCGCGYEFTIHDMKKLQRLPEAIYGGAVKHVDEIQCPQCKKDTLLIIKQQGQTYIVKDIAQKEPIPEDIHVEDMQQVESTTEDIHVKDTTMENEGIIINNNEIICPVCKRTFKNKSGLTVHMKIHANK